MVGTADQVQSAVVSVPQAQNLFTWGQMHFSIAIAVQARLEGLKRARQNASSSRYTHIHLPYGDVIAVMAEPVTIFIDRREDAEYIP